jgi:tetratricopeptide (TPR) repeat protein
MKKAFLLVLILSLFLAKAWADVDLQALNHFKVGKSYISKGFWKDAVKELKTALEISPGYLDALYLLGLAYRGDKNPEEATNCFKKAIEINPQFAAPYLQLAEIYTESLDYVQAHKTLDFLSSRIPTCAEAYYAQGVVYYLEGKLPESIKAWQETLSKNKSYTPAHHNLACALFLDGKKDEAFLEIDRAIKLEPTEPSHIFQLGWFYAQTQQEQEAKATFEKLNLLKSNPFYFDLSQVYLGIINQDLEKAKNFLLEAKKLKSNSVFIFYFEGQIFEAQKQWQESLAQYEQGAKLDPLEPVFREGLKRVKSKMP